MAPGWPRDGPSCDNMERGEAHRSHCTVATHMIHCTPHTAHDTLNTAHRTLYTAHYTLQIAHCTLHTAENTSRVCGVVCAATCGHLTPALPCPDTAREAAEAAEAFSRLARHRVVEAAANFARQSVADRFWRVSP